jgi:uncharacterized membrane protein YphA (DoxX/SURF4 family)
LNGDGWAEILGLGRQRGEDSVSILALTLRFAVATVLAAAALAKARSFGGFRGTVAAVLPRRRGVTVTSAAVVAIEATLAALLAAGVVPSAVAAATAVLFLGFAALSLWAARSGLRVQCNCFGAGDRELGKDSLETSLLLAGATLVYWGLLQRAEPSLALGEAPLAALLGVAAVLGARWSLAARELAGIVGQRRRLESDLAETARGSAR